MKLLLLISFLGLVCGQVLWTGANNTELWEDSNNWNNNTIPTAADDVLIQNFDLQISANIPVTVASLQVLGAFGVVFGQGLNANSIALASGKYFPTVAVNGDLVAPSISFQGNSNGVLSLVSSGSIVGELKVNGSGLIRNGKLIGNATLLSGSNLQLDNATISANVINGTLQQINAISTVSGKVSSDIQVNAGTLRLATSTSIPNLSLGASSVLFLADGVTLNITKLFRWIGSYSSIVSDGTATVNLLVNATSFLIGTNVNLVNVHVNNYGISAHSGNLVNQSLWVNQVGSCCLHCFGNGGYSCIASSPVVIPQDVYDKVIAEIFFFIAGLILIPVGGIIIAQIVGKCKR